MRYALRERFPYLHLNLNTYVKDKNLGAPRNMRGPRRYLSTSNSLRAPEVFLGPWLRLLFCRELRLPAALELWDALFADLARDPAWPLLDAVRAPAGKGRPCRCDAT